MKLKLVEEDPNGSANIFMISVLSSMDKYNESSAVNEPNQCMQPIVKLMKTFETDAVRNILCNEKPLSKEQKSALMSFATERADY